MAPLVAARFPRALRLAGRQDFDAVLKTRSGIAGAQVTVIARPNGGRPARLGLIVPKSLAARAVDRNYVRRIAREQFRVAQTLVQGYDVIVRLRGPYQRAGRRALGREIAALLAQAAGRPRPSGH
jgi:ribonuclease P protein component